MPEEREEGVNEADGRKELRKRYNNGKVDKADRTLKRFNSKAKKKIGRDIDRWISPKNRRTSERRTTRETREISATVDEAKREKEQPEEGRGLVCYGLDQLSAESGSGGVGCPASHTSLGYELDTDKLIWP